MRNPVLIVAACTLLSFVAVAADPINTLTDVEQKEGYILLFNGKDLAGWDGDTRLWSVEDGAIVGSTDDTTIDQNSFLIYQRPFSDFVLKAEVRLRNHNSGIQFRSKASPDWVVTGYQADASESGERSAWGNLYDEKGRGRGVMSHPNEGWDNAKPVVRHGEWNQYVVYAEGSHIRFTLNGVDTLDLTDDAASSGVIAIQLHSGPSMRVELRNLKLKPLR